MQPFSSGVTVSVAVCAAPTAVAVKAGMAPVPLAPRPMAGLELDPGDLIRLAGASLASIAEGDSDDGEGAAESLPPK